MRIYIPVFSVKIRSTNWLCLEGWHETWSWVVLLCHWKKLGWRFYHCYISPSWYAHLMHILLHLGAHWVIVIGSACHAIEHLKVLEPFSLTQKWAFILWNLNFMCTFRCSGTWNGVSALRREISAAFPVDVLNICEPFERTNWPTFFNLHDLIINVSNRFTPGRTEI